MFTDYLRLAKDNFCYILTKSDMMAIRLVISVGSLLWAIMWLVQEFNPVSFMSSSFTSYSSMVHLMDEKIWAALFFIHFLASFAGLLLKRREAFFMFFDSVLGAALWTGTTSMMLFTFYAVGKIPPAMIGSHFLVALFSWWTLARNDYNQWPLTEAVYDRIIEWRTKGK